MNRKDLFDRMDYLIEKLRSNTSQEVIFEIDELLLSLLSSEHFIYQNFLKCLRIPNTTPIEKREYMCGVLNGLKNHIELSSIRKYQVFLSSTYQDLIPFRQAVLDAILFANHIPAGMENFKASSTNPTEHIKNVIDTSDYYVLLIGQRYGSIQNSENQISFTKMEYEYAKQKEMNILAFVYSGDTDLPDNDLCEKGDLLNAFKREILVDFTVNYFKSPDELKSSVIQSLQDEISNHPQTGWIRL